MASHMRGEGMLCLVIPQHWFVHEEQCEGHATIAILGSSGESG
jgi:hypothetical protein